MTGPRAILVVLLLALVLRVVDLGVNAPMSPVSPLALADSIGPFTVRKIGALRDQPATCQATLREAGEQFTLAPPISQDGICGYSDALTLRDGEGLDYRPGPTASCPVIVGLFLWEKQVLQPAAQRFYGEAVASVETLGTYACRRVGGAATGRVSEHASANAVDIAAIRLADGRRIAIASDWTSTGKDAAFLRAIRDGACLTFATVLSPDYNEAHRDHLHFDQAPRGGYRFCR